MVFVSDLNSFDGFIRVNVAKIVKGAPFRFEDLEGKATYPMRDLETKWFHVWPKTTMAWENYALNVLKKPSKVVEERDLLYVDEWSIVHAIEFFLPF